MERQELINTLIAVDRIAADLNQADQLVCMSEALKDACIFVGIDREKIEVLGNRVSTRRFIPLQQKNYDQRTIRALFIGRLQEQKNIHGICQALAILKMQGWKVSLDICGGGGFNDYLRGATSCLTADEWFFHGSVSNSALPALYNGADMYVGPSLFEGFQIPLIEALACGKPCVASNQAPADEIITEELGALVMPEDPESIASGILSVKTRLNDPAKSEKLRVLCRNSAELRWSYAAVSRREAELYLKTIIRFRGVQTGTIQTDHLNNQGRA